MTSGQQVNVLDCSRLANALFWCAVGSALALTLMFGQGARNWASMLRVGSTNPARAMIEAELGPIVSPDPIGHDGQLYYLMARDPFARGRAVAILSSFDTNPPRYRYRRILFPLLAGGLGQFGGRTTLFGMTALVVLGVGLATVALADIAFHLRLSGGAVFLAAVNVGALVSAMILTADTLALGLALSSIALAFRRQLAWALAVLALAGLTKEVYLLTSLSLACWLGRERRWKAALAMAIIPFVPVLLWSAWVWSIVPDVQKSAPLVGWPLMGLIKGVARWPELHGDNPIQQVMGIYAGISFAVMLMMLMIGHNTLLRWVGLPWVALAVCSTNYAVWDIPNNVARAFAIVWPIGMLLCAEWMSFRSRQMQNQASVST